MARRKLGGQSKGRRTKWTRSPKAPRPTKAPRDKALACRNGCGKTFSYPGYLRNHEKTCLERMAPGYGDATGIWSPPARCHYSSPPARCRMGCGGHFVYLAIHELECVTKWKRPVPRPNDASAVPKTLEPPIADDAECLRRLVCRGCGARYAYAKCLKTHETECLGHSRTKTKRLAAKELAQDVPETHAARAAANDAFTRAVFARLADAGDAGERRFKWLSSSGELAS